jgi:hypothetical protein
MPRTHRRISVVGWLVVGVVIGLGISGRLAVTAQERVAQKGPAQDAGEVPVRSEKLASSVQDALLRPYSFTFAKPTTLTELCAQLKQTLHAPVVLDLAALARREIDADATVQLQLEGVRLKTGLKLLLDQVELTYHVIPEDNLLIITDTHGSTDPLDRVLSSLQALHRDLHEVQDTIDEIVVVVGDDEEAGPTVRKPTIIEEMPGAGEKAGTPKVEKPLDKGERGEGRLPRRAGKVPLGFRGR